MTPLAHLFGPEPSTRHGSPSWAVGGAGAGPAAKVAPARASKATRVHVRRMSSCRSSAVKVRVGNEEKQLAKPLSRSATAA